MNVFFENKFENKIITRDSNFWIDENGNHPKPLDLIWSEDINKKWFVKDKKYQEQADEWVESKYSQGKFFVIIDFQKYYLKILNSKKYFLSSISAPS
jgi:hypothetical protein